jgi:hypothetical protein
MTKLRTYNKSRTAKHIMEPFSVVANVTVERKVD